LKSETDLSDYYDVYEGMMEHAGVSISNKSIDDFIDRYVDDLVNAIFDSVKYSAIKEQPNYIEIWAEKQGVIPEKVAREFNATMRPAGGGEFSIKMCSEAVSCAKRREKNLHVFMLSDFDPKGMDMPKSVARKIELIARQEGITAFVHYVGLTKEQCIEYNLPSNPAKTPKGSGTGVKAYKTHTKIFKRYAGQDPTEINSFKALYPAEYNEIIRNAISPYYDTELKDKLDDAISELMTEMSDKIRENIEKHKEEIVKKRDVIKTKFEELNKAIDEKKEELGLDEIIEDYKELLEPNLVEDLEGIEIDMPEAEVS
ncbi:unnamed protein product, partial [marine sediment metagenome]